MAKKAGATKDKDIVTKKWIIEIDASGKPKPNANFFFISAIRSVAGNKPDSELFDLFFKFKYGKNDGWFSILAADLALNSSGSTDTTAIRINEGMANINMWWPGREEKIETYRRLLFLGGGLKIFNERMYAGGHLGSMEINGPFFSSYVLAGYYKDVFLSSSALMNPDGPNNFRHNLYAEVAISANGTQVPIISDLRIKIGLMVPIGPSDGIKAADQAINRTNEDVITRIVLEVPIGKIFTF